MRALLLALVMLSGCLGFGCEPQGAWTDPALWEAVDAPVEPGGGMDIGLDNATLGQVTFRVGDGPNYPGKQTMFREPARFVDGVLIVTVGEDEDIATARPEVRAFLRDASSLNESAIEDAIDEMENHRREVGAWVQYQTGEPAIETPFYEHTLRADLDARLFLETIDALDLERTYGDRGAYHVSYALATKELDLGDHTLKVDAWGNAWTHRPGEGDVNVAALRAELQDAGLPVPSRSDLVSC